MAWRGRGGAHPGQRERRLLPKSLFGERYVALERDGPSASRIKAGDVITRDRGSDRHPDRAGVQPPAAALQAVRPADLATPWPR